MEWKAIPETTSPALYHRLKQEILSLGNSGLVLIRLAELKQRMEMTLGGTHCDLAEMEAVVSLLLRRHCAARRAEENSPAVHRWVAGLAQ